MLRTAILLVALLAASAASAESLPRFERGECPVDVSFIPRPVTCGVLSVAENRARPHGRTVAIPVVIVRATASDRKPDPVIFLHGGPGGAVLENLRSFFDDSRVWRPKNGPSLPPMTTDDRDWIFFDQRGTGLSQPNLDCGRVQLTDSGLVSDVDIARTTACAQRLQAAGTDLTQYNSETVAADVADLRRALGVKQVNLFGISYGSRVAFAVQQHQPAGVRAAIHDSPYPPEAKGTEDLPWLVAREVREIIALCEADEACRARHGGLDARLTQAARDWAQNPRTVAGTTYAVEDLASFLLDASYSWAGTRALPRDLDAILNGNMAALDTYMAGRSLYQEGQNLATFCKEELPFESAARMRAKAGDDPLAHAIVTTAARYFEACKTWPVGAPNPREIEPVRGDVPTLLIASAIDAGCPTDFAERAAALLPSAQMVAVPNMTHGATRRSACARAMVHAMLADPQRPVNRACLAYEHAALPFTLDPAP